MGWSSAALCGAVPWAQLNAFAVVEGRSCRSQLFAACIQGPAQESAWATPQNSSMSCGWLGILGVRMFYDFLFEIIEL